MTDKTKGFSFKTANKNVLNDEKKIFNKEDEVKKVKIVGNMGRKPKKPDEAIIKKVSLTLTKQEYERFLKDYRQSGFPSESSFLKFLVKKYEII